MNPDRYSALNIEFARDGYLVSPDGRHMRHVIGLDRIARDTIIASVSVVWCVSPHTRVGWCDWQRRRIVLSSRLYWCLPWLIRDVWSHELGHVIEGPSQERARLWQQRAYGELIAPLWAA